MTRGDSGWTLPNWEITAACGRKKLVVVSPRASSFFSLHYNPSKVFGRIWGLGWRDFFFLPIDLHSYSLTQSNVSSVFHLISSTFAPTNRCSGNSICARSGHLHRLASGSSEQIVLTSPQHLQFPARYNTSYFPTFFEQT
eukprot:g26317.t1